MSKSIIITEQQVLACYLKNSELLDKEESCFFQNDASICIFNGLKKIRKEKGDFLTSTVVAYCSPDNADVDFELIDGLKTEVEFSIDSFDYYHKRLVEEYVKSKLLTETLKTATEGLLAKGDFNINVLKNLSAKVDNAISLLNNKSTLLDLPTLLTSYENNLRNLKNNKHFASSGCHYLDSKLYGGGFEFGQLTSIFGNSGNGKSIFVEKLINGKINRQEPVLYVPTEMGQFSTIDRLIAMRTGIPISSLNTVDKETGDIPDYVLEEFLKEKKRLSRNTLFRLLDQPGLSVNSLQQSGRDMKKFLGIDYLSIYVDLGSMLKDFGGDNKASRYEDALNELFAVAKEENFAIIPVFQTKRKNNVSVTEYADCRKFSPTIEDLKNSGAIEERSRVVISVFRQKYYGERILGKQDPEVMIADDIMDVSIQKQNNGPLSTTRYLYDGPTGHLAYLEDDSDTRNI